MPGMKFVISSPYGELSEVRNFEPHMGVDIPLEVGTKLRSIIDGTIERVIRDGAEIGNAVIIRGEDGRSYIFGHLDKITAKVGQHVEAGRDIIGLSGNTGHSTGPHLHFAIQNSSGEYIDPTPAVKFLEGVTGADPTGAFIGSQPLPGSFMDWLNGIGDKFIGKEKEIVGSAAHPIQTFIMDAAHDFAHWFVGHLPDIMGYGAIAAGVFIILGAMTGGKGGMMKPLGFYAALLIIAICILAG